MNTRDFSILSQFAAGLRERFPGTRVIAFGSRARGRSAEDSDLDVCVITEKLDEAVDQEIMKLAWEVGFENDLLISTIPYSRQEFEEGPCSQSPLVRTVLREGIPV